MFYALRKLNPMYNPTNRKPKWFWAGRGYKIAASRIPVTSVLRFCSDDINSTDRDSLINYYQRDGWELYKFVPSKKTVSPAIAKLSKKYTQDCRALAGTGAMLTSLLTRLGYPLSARQVQAVVDFVKKTQSNEYLMAKARLEKESKDALL